MNVVKALLALIVLFVLCATCMAYSFCVGWDCGRNPSGPVQLGQKQQQADASIVQTGGLGNTANVIINNYKGSFPNTNPTKITPSYSSAEDGYETSATQIMTDFAIPRQAAMVLITKGLYANGIMKVDESPAQACLAKVNFRLTQDVNPLLQEAAAAGVWTPKDYMGYIESTGWTGVRLVMDDSGSVPTGIALLSGENPISGGVEHYTVTYAEIAGGYNVVFSRPVWLINDHTGGYSASLARPNTAKSLV